MTPRIRSLVLLCGVIGLGFSGASAWVHYRINADPGYASVCDINATLNCTQVYLSQYGSFQGVPTALGGLAWFGLAVLLAAFGGRQTLPSSKAKPEVSPVGAYLFAWATIGLAVILYLAYASFFVLKTACVFCIGTYVCVIAIFVLSRAATSVPLSDLPGRLVSDLTGVVNNSAMLTATVIFLAGIGSAIAFFPQHADPGAVADQQAQADQAAPPPADQMQAWLVEWDKAPREETGVPADDARVVIVKFSDFQCPGCREGWVLYQPILDEFATSNPGAVKFVLKDFPLEAECNFATPNSNHFTSCEASAAVRMARVVGKAAEMEAWLFTNQTRLTGGVSVVEEGLKQVTGLTNFAQQYPRMLAGIRQDVSDGVALRLESTPTYFVNGVRMIGNILPPAYFKLVIEHELEKAAGGAVK